MIRSIARRTSATVALALAGAVAFGAVALAPAASAATDEAPVEVDGGFAVIDAVHGPDAFLVTDRGRTPIFFCDADKPNQRQNLCQADPESGGRF
jgi:hypothetical protein